MGDIGTNTPAYVQSIASHTFAIDIGVFALLIVIIFVLILCKKETTNLFRYLAIAFYTSFIFLLASFIVVVMLGVFVSAPGATGLAILIGAFIVSLTAGVGIYSVLEKTDENNQGNKIAFYVCSGLFLFFCGFIYLMAFLAVN